MQKYILYTTHCPKCNVLKKKLEQHKIDYEENENVDEIIEKGFSTAPVLYDGNFYYSFEQAIQLIGEVTESFKCNSCEVEK